MDVGKVVVGSLVVLLAGNSSLSAQDDPASPSTETQTEEAKGGIRVDDAVICEEVIDHEPIAPADTFSAALGQIACWTRIADGAEQEIVHAWIHEGTTRARVELSIGGARWRTYSTKRILPSWTGSWEVKVMTPDGVVLQSVPFIVE